MEQSEFIKNIKYLLSSMGDISVDTTNKEYVKLYKEGVVFGRIERNKVLLLNDNNKFTEVENSLIKKLLKPEVDSEDKDKFLQEATKAWWKAIGKMF